MDKMINMKDNKIEIHIVLVEPKLFSLAKLVEGFNVVWKVTVPSPADFCRLLKRSFVGGIRMGMNFWGSALKRKSAKVENVDDIKSSSPKGLEVEEKIPSEEPKSDSLQDSGLYFSADSENLLSLKNLFQEGEDQQGNSSE